LGSGITKETDLKDLKRLLAVGGIVVVSALGVAACGDDDEDSATNESAETSQPTVSFTEPSDGSTVGSKVSAEVELEGFELDPDAVGMAAEDGHGHLHFSLDGGRFDTAKYSGPNGELAEELGVDGQYSPSVEPSITYSNLPAGEHTLVVELAENDHSDVGISDETTFTVG
jgi:hypothetical protein